MHHVLFYVNIINYAIQMPYTGVKLDNNWTDITSKLNFMKHKDLICLN